MQRISLLTAVLAAMLVLPSAHAYTGGTVVDKGDTDVTPSSSTKASKLCTMDTDGNGKIDLDEPVFLVKRTTGNFCSFLPKDIRLVKTPGGDAFTEIAVTSPEMNFQGSDIDAAGVNHAFAYFDIDIDAKVKAKDTVYLSLNGAAKTTSTIGDIRLTPFGNFAAGTKVMNGDADVGLPLKSLPGGAACTDIADANIVGEFGKGTYINISCGAAGDLVAEGDIRLLKSSVGFADLAPAKTSVTDPTGPSAVAVGGWFTIRFTVQNTDTVAGTPWVITTLDDWVMDTRSGPTLGAGKKIEMAVALPAPLEAGMHVYGIGDSKVVINAVDPGVTVSLEAAQPAEPAAVATVVASEPPAALHASAKTMSLFSGSSLMTVLALVGMCLSLVSALRNRKGT